MSQLPDRLESYMCSFVTQSAKYAFELETGSPGELLATTLLLWAKTAATESIRCATVNAICSLITASEGAREKISSQNGLQVVADCLHSSKTENGIGACAQTLTALARVSRDRRILCCHRFALIDLVNGSQTRSEATAKKCAACLKELALEYSCHQVILKCSAVEATSVFLRKRPADAVVKLLLIFWHNLSCTQSSWARFGPHLDILSVYLNHSSTAVQSLTLCILCNVLSDPVNCEHFGRQTVFKSVIDRSSPLSVLGVSTKTCFVLQNALRFSTHCRKTFAEKGGVSMMMKLVLIYEENEIRKSALTVVLMTIQQIPTECFVVLSSITQLLDILNYDLTSFEVAVRILKLFAFLAQMDDVTRQKITAVNAISVVVQLFDIPQKLGDKIVLKHHKDGDRILALKLTTAFMSLLSRSKKVLPRLATHGGLTTMISVLAEHSISALPEEILVNASIFLANFSADRQGLNDIVSTCGIPVVLKSAVAIASAICGSNSESQSPYRMRKFNALKGLPSSPQGLPAPFDTNSQDNIVSEGSIKSFLAVELAKSMETVSVSGPLKPVSHKEIMASQVFDAPRDFPETAALIEAESLTHSTMMTTATTLVQEIFEITADTAVPVALAECGNPVLDKKSWLSLIGMPAASCTMVSIIKASVARFQRIESIVETFINDIIDQIESNSSDKKGLIQSNEEKLIITETPKVIMNDLKTPSASHDSKAISEKVHVNDLGNREPEADAAQSIMDMSDVEAALRVVVEEVITRAGEVVAHTELRSTNYDAESKDSVEWAKSVDEEDTWETDEAKKWKEILVAQPALLQDDTCEAGTALALLVKCLQNLCAGEPAARKQMLECGASSFLIACIIPITGTKTSRSRQLEGIPVAVPHMIDSLGISVRLDAAGALSNLALSDQTRQNLMASGIFEVLEEVGAWDQGEGEHQAGFNGSGGSRLLREPRELIDRLASFLRTMCGDEKCRRRVRSSSKLQSLASVMPVKLSEHSKYQENGMQYKEVICSGSMYTTKFIAVERKLSAEHA